MSIPREGSRDISDGIIVSVTPDVCKTPVGSSLVPIPYSITAVQGDDANTAATVRMTRKRSHNMASLVTECAGDAPGTGTGIVSGTVGSVCHPRTHSGTVNIEGKPAIRHTDEWHMNNRNTVGKLTYIDSTEKFDTTPAIDLAQNPEDEAPDQITHSDVVDAILGGMDRAREEGLPEGSYQVAQSADIAVDIPSGAGTDRPRTVPSPSPTVNRIARGGAAVIIADTLTGGGVRRAQITTLLSELDHYATTPNLGISSEQMGILGAAADRIRQEALPVGDVGLANQIKDEAWGAVIAQSEVAAASPDSGQTPGTIRITRALATTLGACAALACPPQINRYNGGAHACTSQPPKDNRDSHHMPADSATAMPKPMGPAIQMSPADHALTASYKGRALGARYAPQRALAAQGRMMEAFEMDALDAKAIAALSGDPNRYDTAIMQARAYALCLQAHGLLR